MAIAEYFKDGCSNSEKLVEVLKRVKVFVLRILLF